MTPLGILEWRPGRLAAAAEALLADRRRLVGAADALDRWPASWTGPAAAAARDHRGELRRALDDRATELAVVVRAVDEASGTLARARDLLADAVATARTEGFTVGATGELADLRPPVLAGHAAADRARRGAELTDRIGEAGRAAGHADAALAAVLRQVAAGMDADSTPCRVGDLPHAPAPSAAATPAALAVWFATLAPAEQRRVVSEQPELIGGADGIPAWARHTANRNRLAGLRRDHGPHDALDALHRLLRDDSDHRLLLLELDGDQTRAAIAIGDLDRADRVVVHVPGMGAAVDDRLPERMAEVQQLVDRVESSSGSTAGVLWLGYDAPQRDLSVLDPERSVLTPGAAADGAHDLAGFLVGVDHARAADPRLTLVGHSYGSVVAGLAAHASTGLDALVVAGSPGLGTDDVGDLDVPAVYVVEADLDPVADLGWFGTDPSRLDGVTRLPTDAEGDLTAVSGHSAYLTDGSTSQHQLAAVVAGAGGQAGKSERST